MSTCPHCQQVLTTKERNAGKCPLCGGRWELPVIVAKVVEPIAQESKSLHPLALPLARASVAIPLVTWMIMCALLGLAGGAGYAGPRGDAMPIILLLNFAAFAGLACGAIALVAGAGHNHVKLLLYALFGSVLSGTNLLIWLIALLLQYFRR